MDERLSGNTLMEYSLEAHAEGGVTDPLFLAEVSGFAEWFREQPSVRHVSVITDTLRQLNQSLHGGDPPPTGFQKARSWWHSTCCSTSSRFPKA